MRYSEVYVIKANSPWRGATILPITPALPKAKDIYNEAFVIMDEETKQPMAHVRYRLESASGVKLEGMTDAQGRTQRIFTSKSEKLTLHLPDDE